MIKLLIFSSAKTVNIQEPKPKFRLILIFVLHTKINIDMLKITATKQIVITTRPNKFGLKESRPSIFVPRYFDMVNTMST